jgi:UDP-N-acetylglucosamine 2-epimerase (non-hydrolysing)
MTHAGAPERDIVLAVGARPNFMKAAPLLEALRRAGCRVRLVHTGQHYDQEMSDVFFRDLGMPAPDVSLGVGSGTHAEQTGQIMVAFETVLLEARPDLVVVVGDVNSTLACALVAAKLGIPLAHVEAGLRSFDRTMPEEVNRVAVDALADLLFTPSPDADENLAREGVPPERIHRVGNIMVDTLLAHLPRARHLGMAARLGLGRRRYGVVTLHRPSNVDEPARLRDVVEALCAIAADVPLAFPAHPRTAQHLRAAGLDRDLAARPALCVLPALSYLEFLGLLDDAAFAITDSGGVQEETTVLGVPCLTLRNTTERPVTVTVGTNTVVGTDPAALRSHVGRILAGAGKTGGVPAQWDGRTAERIAAVLASYRASEAQASTVPGLRP